MSRRLVAWATGMSIAVGMGCAATMAQNAAPLAMASPQPSPSPTPKASGDKDVIVVGERPRVEAGLWSFHRSPSRTVMEAVAGRASRRLFMTPGSDWQQCIPDEEVEAAVRRLLGDSPDAMRIGCSRPRVRFDRGRVSARASCSRLRVSSVERYEGRLQPTSLDVSVTTESEGDAEGVSMSSRTQGRLTAQRVGDCPARRR